MAPSSAPASRTEDAFNRMVAVEIDNVEAAAQIVFQLRTLARQNKLDFLGRIALAEALLIAGYREEAIGYINAAFHMCDFSNYPGVDRLAMLLAHVGHREQALATSRRFTAIPGVAAIQHCMNNASIIAAWAGEVKYLEELAALQRGAGSELVADNYLAALDHCGMRRHFSTHQRTIIEVTKDVQVHAATVMMANEVGASVITNMIYIDGTLANRIDVQDQIDEALRAYYCNVDDDVDGEAIALIVSEAPRSGGLPSMERKSRAA